MKWRWNFQQQSKNDKWNENGRAKTYVRCFIILFQHQANYKKRKQTYLLTSFDSDKYSLHRNSFRSKCADDDEPFSLLFSFENNWLRRCNDFESVTIPNVIAGLVILQVCPRARCRCSIEPREIVFVRGRNADTWRCDDGGDDQRSTEENNMVIVETLTIRITACSYWFFCCRLVRLWELLRCCCLSEGFLLRRWFESLSSFACHSLVWWWWVPCL